MQAVAPGWWRNGLGVYHWIGADGYAVCGSDHVPRWWGGATLPVLPAGAHWCARCARMVR